MLALSQEIRDTAASDRRFRALKPTQKNIDKGARCQGASKPATNLLRGIVNSSLNTNAAGTSDKLFKLVGPSKGMILKELRRSFRNAINSTWRC